MIPAKISSQPIPIIQKLCRMPASSTYSTLAPLIRNSSTPASAAAPDKRSCHFFARFPRCRHQSVFLPCHSSFLLPPNMSWSRENPGVPEISISIFKYQEDSFRSPVGLPDESHAAGQPSLPIRYLSFLISLICSENSRPFSSCLRHQTQSGSSQPCR